MLFSKEYREKRDQANRVKWVKTREMGRKKFILIYGVLFWGLFMAIFFFFYNQLTRPSDIWYIRLIISLIIFPLGGYFVGHFSWKAAEKRYWVKENKD